MPCRIDYLEKQLGYQFLVLQKQKGILQFFENLVQILPVILWFFGFCDHHRYTIYYFPLYPFIDETKIKHIDEPLAGFDQSITRLLVKLALVYDNHKFHLPCPIEQQLEEVVCAHFIDIAVCIPKTWHVHQTQLRFVLLNIVNIGHQSHRRETTCNSRCVGVKCIINSIGRIGTVIPEHGHTSSPVEYCGTA